MTPAEWRQVKEAFHGALDREGSGRVAFLDATCGADTAVRREVEALLACYRPAETEPFEGAEHSLAPAAVRERIGRYEVLRELGRGGMSTVYLARRGDRDDQQRVAVKLMHPLLAGSGVAERFRRERHILAGLDHPNVARLLDAGTTGDGLPYLVVEYVEGVPIDRYCEAQGLGITERLRLFLEVCAAVEHAHRNLVVHRDLKPSNVLVDARGTPKLLDFGIAKLINPELAAGGLRLTTAELRPMTPLYASPEQVRGEAVTTSSDVYSLGVLLYELLAGRSPYPGPPRTVAEAERAICDEEPEPASRAAPPERRGRLAGDLDAILWRALRKEPRRRYGSARELADDLRRHLDGRPVEARGGGWSYRAGRLLRRHRRAFAAGALALALLLASLAAALYQARAARAERALALGERDRAERFSSQLLEVLQLADPHATPGAEVSARELLDRGVRSAGAELADEPALEARLLDAIGLAYRNLGLYEPSAETLERAVTLRRERAAGGPLELAASLEHLAGTRHFQGRLASAEGLYRESLEIRRRLLGEEHPEVARGLIELAELLYDRADYDQAEALLRRALEVRRRALGEESAEVAESYHELGDLLVTRSEVDSAEGFYRRSLEIRRRLFDPPRSELADSLQGLAVVARLGGDGEEAERLYRQALDQRREVYGEKHGAVAETLNHLGLLHLERRDPDAAEPYLRQALEIRRGLHAEEHPAVLQSLNNLAMVLYARGDHAAAEPLQRRLLEQARRAHGDEHPDVALYMANLGITLRELGDLEAAEPLLRQAIEMHGRLLGPEHPRGRGFERHLQEVQRRRAALAKHSQ